MGGNAETTFPFILIVVVVPAGLTSYTIVGFEYKFNLIVSWFVT